MGSASLTALTDTRMVLHIGVPGGFTTYSTFGVESFSLLKDGEFVKSLPLN
jgi:fluoride ion exporter CrcB/FEX